LKGSVEEMVGQVLQKSWVDESKAMALVTLKQYAEFQGLLIPAVHFKVYDNAEMHIPTPEMVKRFIYRIRELELRATVMIAHAPHFPQDLQSPRTQRLIPKASNTEVETT
jgi:hypothetical protein